MHAHWCLSSWYCRKPMAKTTTIKISIVKISAFIYHATLMIQRQENPIQRRCHMHAVLWPTLLRTVRYFCLENRWSNYPMCLTNFIEGESQAVLTSLPRMLKYICNVPAAFSDHSEIHRHIARCIANLALYGS